MLLIFFFSTPPLFSGLISRDKGIFFLANWTGILPRIAMYPSSSSSLFSSLIICPALDLETDKITASSLACKLFFHHIFSSFKITVDSLGYLLRNYLQ